MKKLGLLLCGTLFAFSAQAQGVEEILNNYFENTGGLEKWESMETMVMRGTAPSPQGDFPFTVYSKKPDMMKVQVDVQGKELIPQAYDGETAWTMNPFTGDINAKKIPADLTWTVEDQAQFEAAYINYQEKGHEISYEGEEVVDGTNTFKLKVVKNKNNEKNDITEYHFFDSENYVPIMVRSTTLAGPAKGTESETYFSDYQETAYGVYVPYYFETRTNGQVSQKIVVNEVDINVELGDEVFAFPEPVEQATEPTEEESAVQMQEKPEREEAPTKEMPEKEEKK